MSGDHRSACGLARCWTPSSRAWGKNDLACLRLNQMLMYLRQGL
jgi:hypothetical protein